ncbi:hypothetical protein DXA21_16480 [Parabacteroides distasonis]|nr:hypothetical protein DXA21_16480 [Parabacteroides distasonis]
MHNILFISYIIKKIILLCNMLNPFQNEKDIFILKRYINSSMPVLGNLPGMQEQSVPHYSP